MAPAEWQQLSIPTIIIITYLSFPSRSMLLTTIKCDPNYQSVRLPLP